MGLPHLTLETRLPSNDSRLIDLKQSVTLTGLGAQSFNDAVAAMLGLYQHMHTYLSGYNLRPWEPARISDHLTLMFGNRYLTPAKYAAGELSIDLGEYIDPFNVLRPRLTAGQAHLQENVVEYWEQEVTERGDM